MHFLFSFRHVHAFLVLYYVSILAGDFFEYKLDIAVWDQAKRTTQCYDWFEQYLKPGYDDDTIDYSEGLFNGNYSLTLREATINKFNHVFVQLGLQQGMKLLDAGCGTGVWLEYCQKRGVDVVGLTLSPEQAKKVAQKGLNVHVMDYRTLHEPFLNQFDRITALGSSEHVCSSVGALAGDTAITRCNQRRIEVWSLFHRYLKPHGKVFITVITANRKAVFTPMDWFQVYILERHYGGFYSSMDEIKYQVIPYTGFTLASEEEDRTIDYHWSSIIDRDHFGYWTIDWSQQTLNKITYLLYGIVTDPHLPHRWLYYFLDTWLWQFGGFQEAPITQDQLSGQPAHLKYFMLEKQS